ncbi:MAG: HAMP domain-containing sensor histidine kinase, partial [Bacteroidota bacterium]
ELRSRFVSIASHQFRTPLSVIKSNVEFLDEIYSHAIRADRVQRYQNIQKRIDSEIDRLTHLMDDILIMGKLNAGKVKPDFEIVDLYRSLSNVLEEEFHHEQIQHRLNIEVEGELFPVQLDVRLFEHIVGNLLTNAIKFSVDSKPPQIKIVYLKDWVEVLVIDHGIGIPLEDLPHLFDSFYRGSNSEEIPGTGLGLSIVKEFVQINGGKIHVESELGKGSTFILSFPLVKTQNYAGNIGK